ncbi:MAG: Uma2 family endonuclease [Spirosomataceae bacterium]
MVDYVEKILASPDAFRQIEELNTAMKDEKRRRHEFREWITPSIKAEFINGEIILHSPVKRKHWKITDLLSSLLSVYVRYNNLGVVGTEKVMVALTRNDYEPDLVFFSKEKAETFNDDQMLFPAPDFVVEILSKKTAAKDRGIKKQDYAAHGIREYWIIDPNRQEIEQYVLLSPNDDTYLPARVFTLDHYIDSFAIKGFEIPVAAIFDPAANMEALQEILAKRT